jgi:hypothetical protein
MLGSCTLAGTKRCCADVLGAREDYDRSYLLRLDPNTLCATPLSAAIQCDER